MWRETKHHVQDEEKEGKEWKGAIRKIEWNIKPVDPYLFPQVYDLLGLCPKKLSSFGKVLNSHTY